MLSELIKFLDFKSFLIYILNKCKELVCFFFENKDFIRYFIELKLWFNDLVLRMCFICRFIRGLKYFYF